jgi:hypothetical protein
MSFTMAAESVADLVVSVVGAAGLELHAAKAARTAKGARNRIFFIIAILDE